MPILLLYLLTFLENKAFSGKINSNINHHTHTNTTTTGIKEAGEQEKINYSAKIVLTIMMLILLL